MQCRDVAECRYFATFANRGNTGKIRRRDEVLDAKNVVFASRITFLFSLNEKLG